MTEKQADQRKEANDFIEKIKHGKNEGDSDSADEEIKKITQVVDDNGEGKRA